MIVNVAFGIIVSILLIIFGLNYTLMIDKGSALTDPPSSTVIDHQEIMNNNSDWTQIDVPLQLSTFIPDGRKIWYNSANDTAECEGRVNGNTDISGTLPDITSVSYYSDGEILNTMFWLSKAPLINHNWQNLSELSKINQEYLLIDRYDISDFEYKYLPRMTDDEKLNFSRLTDDEKTNIERRYPNVDITNNYTTTLSNKPAAGIVFEGVINDTTFGNRHITGFEEFTIENSQLYRI